MKRNTNRGSSGRRKMEGNGSIETQEEIKSPKTVTIKNI